MTLSWKELKYLWQSDFFRTECKAINKSFFHALMIDCGFRYVFLYRICNFLNARRTNIIGRVLYRVFFEILRHYQVLYGIYLPPATQVGSGFYIGHYGAIVINADVIIGKNCNISQSVTIGQSNRGEKKGCPVIGDNVYIAPGAVLFGKIKIGNNVAIGANAVVTRDIPDNAVAAGIPAQVISYEGSMGYVNRTDY